MECIFKSADFKRFKINIAADRCYNTHKWIEDFITAGDKGRVIGVGNWSTSTYVVKCTGYHVIQEVSD